MRFEVKDAGDLKAVNRALRQAANGKQLRVELRRELRRELAPLVTNVRRAWRSAPSRRRLRRGQGLRSQLARSTIGVVRLSGREAGVRVRTDGRKMPAGMRALPTYAEGTKRPWRHPVFGNSDTWVTERPFPRFYAAVQPDERAARRRVEQAVERVFDQIVRAR